MSSKSRCRGLGAEEKWAKSWSELLQLKRTGYSSSWTHKLKLADCKVTDKAVDD